MYGVASVIVAATVLPLLGVLAVCLRFYVRVWLKPTFVGIDDWLIAFSCFLVLGQGAMQIAGMILKPRLTDQNVQIDINLELTIFLALHSRCYRRAWKR